MNKEDLKNKIVNEVEKQRVPVNTEFIARKVGVGWGRASRLLLALTVQGRIKALPTLNAFVCYSAKNESITIGPELSGKNNLEDVRKELVPVTNS